MPAPQDQACGGLSHPADELRDAKARLDVPAHGVEQEEDAVHLLVLLQACKQGHDVLIFGGLGVVRQDLVALHLPDDGEGVDVPPAAAADRAAQVHQPLLVRLGVPAFLRGAGLFGLFFHGITPFPG